MPIIFLAASPSDLAAVRVRRELEALDYLVWQAPAGLTPAMASYGRAVDQGVLASAAVVTVWNAAAKDDEWVEHVLLVAERLRKPVYVFAFDDTPPPPNAGATLVAAGAALNSRLAALTTEARLATLDAQLAHELIRERRGGIEQARAWLNDPSQAKPREILLARLVFMAQYDLMQTLRDLARAVLAAESQKNLPPARPNESHHMFGVRCPNGHVTYYDRRAVCGDHTQFPRAAVRRAGTDLSELVLPCKTCPEKMKVRVDCEASE